MRSRTGRRRRVGGRQRLGRRRRVGRAPQGGRLGPGGPDHRGVHDHHRPDDRRPVRARHPVRPRPDPRRRPVGGERVPAGHRRDVPAGWPPGRPAGPQADGAGGHHLVRRRLAAVRPRTHRGAGRDLAGGRAGAAGRGLRADVPGGDRPGGARPPARAARQGDGAALRGDRRDDLGRPARGRLPDRVDLARGVLGERAAGRAGGARWSPRPP